MGPFAPACTLPVAKLGGSAAPARNFYRRLGGEAVAEKENKRDMATLIEVAYGWRELNRLIEDRQLRGT